MATLTCPLCGHSVPFPPIEEANGYKLYHCVACDLVWADPMRGPGAEWYETHRQYRKTLLCSLDALQWNHRQFLRDPPARGGRLLDIGCGTGRFLAAAARLGYTVTGVDFNPQAVQTARERYGLEDVYCGTLEEFVRDRSPVVFDVVTAFEVLEHVEAPKGFLARIGRLVRPGGFLALSVPYRDRWPRLRSVEQWDIPPHHLSRWSKKALTTALEAAGFAIVDLRTGWMPGEEIILHYVRFGTIEWLFRRATRREVSSTRKQQLVAAASWLMRVKRAGVRLVGAPLNLVLRMAGATGLHMYVLASKQ